MYVVVEIETGYSDESMRFGSDFEATEYCKAQEYPENYWIRYEV